MLVLYVRFVFSAVTSIAQERSCKKSADNKFISQNNLLKKEKNFCMVKNFPQEIENTREIIEHMSEIF